MLWVAAILVGLIPGTPPEALTLRGQVVELGEILDDREIRATDADQRRQLMLRDDQGGLTPLLLDEATRAFAADDRLRHRPAVIQGRRFPGLPFIQAVSIQVEQEGRLRTPEYYCDVCTISVRYPQVCPCCQGPMELRMKPDRP